MQKMPEHSRNGKKEFLSANVSAAGRRGIGTHENRNQFVAAKKVFSTHRDNTRDDYKQEGGKKHHKSK